MASDQRNNYAGADGIKTTQATEPPKIVWDDTGVHDVSADIAQVTGGREEIMLLFGERQEGPVSPGEVRAHLKERVILGAFAAKRLAVLLHGALRAHEAEYGPLKTATLQQTGPARAAWPLTKPPDSQRAGSSDRGDFVIGLVDNLEIKYGIERSLKMSENKLLADRFLLGFKKKRIRQDPHERILDICKRLGMPQSLLASYSEKLPDANYLHFGFEENDKTCLFKAYLEFYEKFEEKLQKHPGPPAPFLMHLGFKWDVHDHHRQAVTNYVWHPLLSVEDMERRVSEILPPRRLGRICEIATQIVAFAARVVHPYDILYLEVSEEDNPRRSFDINIYRAGFPVEALYPFLAEMCRHYGISFDTFHACYDGIKTKRFGHISGGIDREGKDFFTFYFGVEYTATPEPNTPSAPL